jgi:subfamily B ATP-binding cassette protein MsbA
VDSGTLLNTLATETWRTSEALESFVKLIINGCTVVVFSILLLLISWQLTLLVGLIMVLISIIIQFLTRRVKVLGREAVESNATLAKRMHEGLVGIRDIWAFGRERFEQERFDRASKLVRSMVLLQDRTALPILLTFLLMLYRLQPQVQQLGSNRVRFLSLVASVKEVISFLDHSDKQYISSGWIPFQGLKQAISLESVSFQYNSQRDLALRDISIVIPQGKTTALVGPSGAGKSTLVNLICRFYEVTVGAVGLQLSVNRVTYSTQRSWKILPMVGSMPQKKKWLQRQNRRMPMNSSNR